MDKKNQIKPITPTTGNPKKLMKPRARSASEIFEKDLELKGIIKETNNYPTGSL